MTEASTLARMSVTSALTGVAIVLANGLYFFVAGHRREGRRWVCKYPSEAYRLFSGGVFASYALRAAAGLLSGFIFLWSRQELLEQQLPVGISTLMAASPGFWVAIFEPLRRRSRGKGLMHNLLGPAIAAFQLIGTAVAVGVVGVGSDGIAFNSRLFFNPVFGLLVLASWLLTWNIVFAKSIHEKEEKAFQRLCGSADGVKKAGHFLLGKFLLSGALLGTVPWLATFVVTSSIGGLPQPDRPGAFAGAILLAMTGAIGTAFIPIANIKGEPHVNGAAGMAALFLVYLWNWVFQGLIITTSEVIGSSMALSGAIVLALTRRNDEDDLPDEEFLSS